MIIDHRPAFFSFHQLHYVHQRHVLHVLAERSHQRRIAQLRPYIFHFVEKHHQQVVYAEFGLVLAFQYHVDAGMYAFQVRHHGAHHTARKPALQEQGRHMLVGGVHKVTEEVVYELLRHGARFHIGLHIDVGHPETLVTQHGLYGNNVRMHLSPRHGFHGHIYDIGSVFAYLEDGSH